MFFKELKDKKGITLIALVVTIVVLLILAGVTIAMLTGENGIINQAKNAKEESLMSELEELVDLALMEYKTDKESGKDTDLGELLNQKVKDKTFESVTEEEEYYSVEKNGYEVKVSKDGERITDAEKTTGIRPVLKIEKSYNQETNKVEIKVTITNKSQLGTIDSFKLFDSGNQEITEKTSSEDNKAFEVEKNGKYKVEVIATTDKITRTGNKSIVVDEFEMFSDIYTSTKQYTDSEGNTAWIPQGFAVGVSEGINKISTGLVITDQIDEVHNGTGNQFVWIPVGNYKVGSETKTNNLTRRQWGTTVNKVVTPTEVEGDASIKGYNTYAYYKGESTSIGGFLEQAEIKKGFYIGRYEQGQGNVVKAGVAVYSNITRDNAKKQAEALYNSADDSVKSELISSYACDTALNFICQIDEEGYKIATVNSPDYGNLGSGTTLKNTGEYRQDKYCNIYDFLGNATECTTEYSTGSLDPCACRGRLLWS